MASSCTENETVCVTWSPLPASPTYRAPSSEPELRFSTETLATWFTPPRS